MKFLKIVKTSGNNIIPVIVTISENEKPKTQGGGGLWVWGGRHNKRVAEGRCVKQGDTVVLGVLCSCCHAAGRFVSELSLLSNRWGVHTEAMSRDLVHPGDTWPADVRCDVTAVTVCVLLTPSGGKSSVVACTTRQVVTSKASDCRLLFAADIVSCWGFARYLPELSPLVKEALPAAVGTVQTALPVTTQLTVIAC